jgi:hypothetical protein
MRFRHGPLRQFDRQKFNAGQCLPYPFSHRKPATNGKTLMTVAANKIGRNLYRRNHFHPGTRIRRDVVIDLFKKATIQIYTTNSSDMHATTVYLAFRAITSFLENIFFLFLIWIITRPITARDLPNFAFPETRSAEAGMMRLVFRTNLYPKLNMK